MTASATAAAVEPPSASQSVSAADQTAPATASLQVAGDGPALGDACAERPGAAVPCLTPAPAAGDSRWVDALVRVSAAGGAAGGCGAALFAGGGAGAGASAVPPPRRVSA